MNDKLDEKFVVDNEVFNFYTNNITRYVTEYINEAKNFDYYYVLLAETKETKERNFILIDDRRTEIVFYSRNHEDIQKYIDAVCANQLEKTEIK